MEAQHISTTVWGIGKIKFPAADEQPLGPYLAKEIETRVLDLVERKVLLQPQNFEQLWLGMGLMQHDWDRRMLLELIDYTVQNIEAWDNVKSASQACLCLALYVKRTTIRLSDQQHAKLAAAVAKLASLEDDKDLPKSTSALITAAEALRLPLPPQAMKRLHDLALGVSQEFIRQGDRVNVAGSLFRATKLGYQPTAEEAQRWSWRLQEGVTGDWKPDELSWVAAALSACRNFAPPAELKARLKAQAEELAAASKVNPGVASRTATACRRWRVGVAPGVLGRLESFYKKGRS